MYLYRDCNIHRHPHISFIKKKIQNIHKKKVRLYYIIINIHSFIYIGVPSCL